MVPEMFSCIPGERKFRDNCFIDAGVQTKKDTEIGLRRDRMCWSDGDLVMTGGVDFGSRKAIRSGEFFEREVRKLNNPELTVIASSTTAIKLEYADNTACSWSSRRKSSFSFGIPPVASKSTANTSATVVLHEAGEQPQQGTGAADEHIFS